MSVGVMGTKHTLEYVRQCFAERGCELLEDHYINSHTKMRYRCHCGNISYITFSGFRYARGCMQCNGNPKYTLEEVTKIFADGGCELLSDYKGNKSPLHYICSCGRESEISLVKFMMGRRCRDCGLRVGPKHGNWNPDREMIALNKKVKRRYYGFIYTLLKGKKNATSSEILGYTISELKDHLVNHPNWESVKDDKWSVDHIFPVKAFVEHNILDPKIVNCLDNLQPLSQSENSAKGDTYDREEFKKWLQKL